MAEIPSLLTEIRDELGDVKTTGEELRATVKELSKKLARSRGATRTLALLTAALLMLGVVLIFVSWRWHTNLNCIRDWADATSERSASLTARSNARIAAEDKLLTDAIARKPAAVLAADSVAYKSAAAAFAEAVTSVPVPLSYDCRSF